MTGVRLYRTLVRDPDHVDGTLAMMAQWSLDALLARLPALCGADAADRLGPRPRGAVETSVQAARRMPAARVGDPGQGPSGARGGGRSRGGADPAVSGRARGIRLRPYRATSTENPLGMFGEVDPQPRRVALGWAGIRGQPVQRHPAGVRHFLRVGAKVRPGRPGHENLDHLVFDQPAAHIGAVFDRAAGSQRQAGDPQFLAQPAQSAIGRASPQVGWVQQVFAHSPGV